tara:strand:+ start:28565 stop:29200 length:636 start_codon:yes stop_codon:yes gene_type:complete
MKHFFILGLAATLLGCSSTQYDASELVSHIDQLNLKAVKLAIDSENVVLASQANERLFKLHHNALEVKEMLTNIAKRFGFEITTEKQAAYRLNVLDVKPDGGACLEGLSSFNKGLTFTFSVITLGVLPATNGYCIEVTAELFYRPEVYGKLSDEMTSLATFSANKGRINVVAGANEIDNYQRTVTIEDEARAIETSIADLFEDMIKQGAFE